MLEFYEHFVNIRDNSTPDTIICKTILTKYSLNVHFVYYLLIISKSIQFISFIVSSLLYSTKSTEVK